MIEVDIPMPSRCYSCPCSYYIRSGEFEGRMMCQALEYKDGNKATGEYLVNDRAHNRPDNCPIIREIERSI